jgi:hypothetical protein
MHAGRKRHTCMTTGPTVLLCCVSCESCKKKKKQVRLEKKKHGLTHEALYRDCTIRRCTHVLLLYWFGKRKIRLSTWPARPHEATELNVPSLLETGLPFQFPECCQKKCFTTAACTVLALGQGLDFRIRIQIVRC